MTATPNTAALQALLMKVEAGERGSGLNTVSVFGDTQTAMDAVDAFDGSLDAAKALHDTLLPGWDLSICTYEDDLFEVSVSRPTAVQTYDGLSEVIARAWLIAILRALIAAPVAENEGCV